MGVCQGEGGGEWVCVMCADIAPHVLPSLPPSLSPSLSLSLPPSLPPSLSLSKPPHSVPPEQLFSLCESVVVEMAAPGVWRGEEGRAAGE